MLYVCLLRDLCFKLRGRTYTRYDVYGNYDAQLLHRKLYAWSNAYRKEVTAKVRNYNLRNLDKETNMKVLNLFISETDPLPSDRNLPATPQ